jgi:hypothetical protein
MNKRDSLAGIGINSILKSLLDYSTGAPEKHEHAQHIKIGLYIRRHKILPAELKSSPEARGRNTSVEGNPSAQTSEK